MNRLFVCCMCVCALLSETACVGEPFVMADPEGARPTLDNDSRVRVVDPVNLAMQSEDAGASEDDFGRSFVGKSKDRSWKAVELPSQERDDLPTDILFATCESAPDEVAVPLNALDDRYCDTVQATAYNSGEEGAYEVSARYSWEVADGTIAYLTPLPGLEHRGIRRAVVQYDIFSSQDQAKEPETSLTVCAEPLEGWDTAEHPPLCRILPLRAVVNLDAAWCFAGDTFDGDCDARIVEQDGRYLRVHGGPGTIRGKEVAFQIGDKSYSGLLESVAFMSGDVFLADTGQWLGYWEASRMSP